MSVITLTTENFEQEALNSRVPVLIDFGHLGVDHVK